MVLDFLRSNDRLPVETLPRLSKLPGFDKTPHYKPSFPFPFVQSGSVQQDQYAAPLGKLPSYYIDTELDRWHAGHAPASWRSAYLPPIIALILQSRFRPQDVRDVDAVRWESDAVSRHSGDHVRLLPQKTEIPVSRQIFSTD